MFNVYAINTFYTFEVKCPKSIHCSITLTEYAVPSTLCHGDRINRKIKFVK